MAEQPTKLRICAKEIIAWAWEHKIPEVPYERSYDITGALYRALEAQGIFPDHGIFEVTEETLVLVLQGNKGDIFHVIPGGMSRELKEKMDAAYWRSVEEGEWDYDSWDDEKEFDESY